MDPVMSQGTAMLNFYPQRQKQLWKRNPKLLTTSGSPQHSLYDRAELWRENPHDFYVKACYDTACKTLLIYCSLISHPEVSLYHYLSVIKPPILVSFPNVVVYPQKAICNARHCCFWMPADMQSDLSHRNVLFSKTGRGSEKVTISDHNLSFRF